MKNLLLLVCFVVIIAPSYSKEVTSSKGMCPRILSRMISSKNILKAKSPVTSKATVTKRS